MANKPIGPRVCPECGAETIVKETESWNGGGIRRRRECKGKEPHRFYTFEVSARRIQEMLAWRRWALRTVSRMYLFLKQFGAARIVEPDYPQFFEECEDRRDVSEEQRNYDLPPKAPE